MKNTLTRRDFIWKCSASLAAVGAGVVRPSILGAGVSEYRRGGMVYRRLGNTDLWPSLLAFGSHTDPADRVPAGWSGTVLTTAGQARRDRIIAHAFDLGVNMLDIYADMGQWEPAARFVRGRRDKVLVSLAHVISAQQIDNGCSLFGHVDLYRFHTPKIDDRALQILGCAPQGERGREDPRHRHRLARRADDVSRPSRQLEGIDYLFIPYNFIQARAGYSQFLPEAQRRGVGIVAMKPLASGSIMKLDPLARPGAKAEYDFLAWQANDKAASGGRRRGAHARYSTVCRMKPCVWRRCGSCIHATSFPPPLPVCSRNACWRTITKPWSITSKWGARSMRRLRRRAK